MKKLYSNFVAFLLCATSVGNLFSQSLHTALFSDSYLYRHEMNPAMANEDGYFSFPFLGNVNGNAGLGIGVNTLVPKGPNGKLVTFMHESVEASSFLNSLSDNNRVLENFDMQIFSMGFHGFGGYNTLDLGVHQIAGISLPKDLFSFMKEMNPDQTYSFGDMQASARAYADLSLGHSHPIGEYFRFGAKVHFLFGLAYANGRFDNCTATFSESVWRMKMNGTLDMAIGKGNFKVDENGKMNGYNYDKFDVGSAFSNFGFAFDLGATYDMAAVIDGLKLSVSISDLGRISWKDCNYAYNNGKEFEFEGFNNLSMHTGEGEGTIDDQWSDVNDDLKDMYNLQVGNNRSNSETLAATLNVGAEYEFPVYKKLSLGALYSQRFSNIYGYREGRFILNFGPSRCFDMAASYTVSSYGNGLGAMINLHFTGFNIFVGSDNIYFGKVNKYYIPLEKCAANVQFGINFPLRHKND